MAEKYIKIENLSVSEELLNFINNELLPGTKIKKKNFGMNLISVSTN